MKKKSSSAGLNVGRVKKIIPSLQRAVLYRTYYVLYRPLSSNLLVQPMHMLQV